MSPVQTSTQQHIGRKWGTPQPVTLRDKDFGMVRLRAFGMYAYRIEDVSTFFTQISGARPRFTRDDLEGQLRNLVVSCISSTLGASTVPFLDMAANQGLMGDQVKAALGEAFKPLGLALEGFAVENISLPEDLQKALDTRISMGMAGDLKQFTQYQVAQSIPLAAQNEGGLAGLGAELATGLTMGQAMAGAMMGALPTAGAAQEDLGARLEKLKGLLDKGLITQADYDSAKAEVLKKLIG